MIFEQNSKSHFTAVGITYKKELFMKKNKKLAEGLAEGLLELILTFIFFGIGAGIVALFGIDFNTPSIDHDLLVLLGIVVFFVFFAIVFFLVERFKKRKQNKQEESFSSHDKNE